MLSHIIFWSAIPMFIDVIYNLFHFRYYYLRELKYRFILHNQYTLPNDYIFKLQKEYLSEEISLQNIINFLYVPWSVCLLFTSLWYVTVILAVINFVDNLLLKKAYISPMKFGSNLVLLGSAYLLSMIHFIKLINL